MKTIGDVVLDVKSISLAFGGVKALTDISFDVREHEIRAIIGPPKKDCVISAYALFTVFNLVC